MLKSVKCLMYIVSFAVSMCTADIIDVYDFEMTLKIPRVYDNMQSLGYRQIQSQKLQGELNVRYTDEAIPILEVVQLGNKTQKTSTGNQISYQCETDELSRFNYIGDNRKKIFKTPAMRMYLMAEPSYALTEMQEDNSLYLELAGYGTSSKSKIKGVQIPVRLSGYAAGTLGCGCTDYGHVSPTRVIGPMMFSDLVDDVAPVYGKWKMKFKYRKHR